MDNEKTSSKDLINAIEEYRRLVAAKMAQVKFRSAADWLAFAPTCGVPDSAAAEHDIWIAVAAAGLPSLGERWTALFIISPTAGRGRIWANAIEGAIAWTDSPLVVFEGQGEIASELVEQILPVFRRNDFSSFGDIPSRCYDGGPTTMLISTRKTKTPTSAFANAADSGNEPSLILSRWSWYVFNGLDLIETQRHPKPTLPQPPLRKDKGQAGFSSTTFPEPHA